jgi:hypothetical protein
MIIDGLNFKGKGRIPCNATSRWLAPFFVAMHGREIEILRPSLCRIHFRMVSDRSRLPK